VGRVQRVAPFGAIDRGDADPAVRVEPDQDRNRITTRR
jgi:hypothetical protein